MKIPFGYGEKIGNFLGTRAARATFNKIPGVEKLPTLQKLSESWREHAQRIGQAGQTASHFGVEDEGVGGISVPSLSRVRIPGSLTRAAARVGVNIAANVVDSLSRLPIPDLDTRILESISKMEIGTTIDLEGVLGNIGSAAETAGGFVYGIWKDNPDLQEGFKEGFKEELKNRVRDTSLNVRNIAVNIIDGARIAGDSQNDLIARESTPERLAREQQMQVVHERSQAANIQGRAIADIVRQRQRQRHQQDLAGNWEEVNSSDVESSSSGDTSPLLGGPSPMPLGRQPLVSTSMPAPRAQRVVDLTELESDQLPLSLTQARGDFLNASSSSRRSPIPSPSPSEGSGDTEMLISRSSSHSSTSSNLTTVIDPDDPAEAERRTDTILGLHSNSSTSRTSVARPPSPSPSEGSGDTSPLLGSPSHMPLDTSPFRRRGGIGYQILGGMESRAVDGISSVYSRDSHMPPLGSSIFGVGPQSYRSTASSGDRLYGNLDRSGVGSSTSQQPSFFSQAREGFSGIFSGIMEGISAGRNRRAGYSSIEMGGGSTSSSASLISEDIRAAVSSSPLPLVSVSTPPSGAVPENRPFSIEGEGNTVASQTSTGTKSRAPMDKGFMGLMGAQMGLEFLNSSINQITAEAGRDVQLMASSQQQAELNEENNAQADQNRHSEGLQWLQMRRGSRRF